jgi:hypothetical protein
MALPRKECPECKGLSELDAAACGGCGHRYRTQFVHGAPLTAPGRTPSAVSPSRMIGWLVVGAAVIAVVLALAVSIAGGVRSPDDARFDAVRLGESESDVLAALQAPDAKQTFSLNNPHRISTWRYPMTGGRDFQIEMGDGEVRIINEFAPDQSLLRHEVDEQWSDALTR